MYGMKRPTVFRRGVTMPDPGLSLAANIRRTGIRPSAEMRGVRSIKHYLAALPAILVVAALIVSTAPVEAGTRRVALGIWSGTLPSRDINTFDDFANDVGRRPAIWAVSSLWGAVDSQDFPKELASQARSRGATLLVAWIPVKGPPISTEDGTYSRYRNIVEGEHDDYIRQWAKDAKSFGGPVLVRFAHEMNGKYFPWGTGYGEFPNTPTDFKAAWRYVVKKFRKVGATNVKFVWTPSRVNKKKSYTPWYPGDRWVHYVGFSNFNWGTYFTTTKCETFVQGISMHMAKFSRFTSKPVIIAELGTTPKTCNGITKPEWIRSGYKAVRRRYPKIKAIVYQNVDLSYLNHPDWSLDNPPEAMDAYGDVAASRLFQGRVTSKGVIK
jgi:hypothetical protein